MKKPLITIFSTPNNKYFYDSCLCEMVRISGESYNCLENILYGKEQNIIALTEELKMYKQKGYLKTESPIKIMKHPYTDYLKVFLERKIQKITLQVTQNCNFRCKYCIYDEKNNDLQRAHSAKRMSWEIAKKAVDFLWDHSVDSKKVDIGFYGGEPLLEIGLIKRVVKYSKEKFRGKQLTFSITSNLSLLTEDIVRFFIENDISLTLSLDGPKEINDKNRVFQNGNGTYDKVIEKIKLIKMTEPDYLKKMMISMVINPENDFDCVNSICFETNIEDFLGINAAMVDKNYGTEEVFYTDNYINKTQYHSFLALLTEFNRYSSKKISKINQTWMAAFISDVKKIQNVRMLCETDAPSGSCVPGQLRLFINTDGNLYPCERVSEISELMKIGNLEEGISTKKAQDLLNVGSISAEKCKNCWAFRFCTICVQKADDGGSKLSINMKMKACRKVLQDVYNKMKGQLLFQEVQEYYRENIIREKSIDGK